MKIKVSDFGVIKSAEIDLSKSFIIFCGQNNTGKTYMAYLLYSITSFQISRVNLFDIDWSNFVKDGFASIEINPKKLFNYRKDWVVSSKNKLESIFGISDEQVELLFDQFEIELTDNFEIFRNQIKDSEIENKIELRETKIKIKKSKNSLDFHLELSDDSNVSEFVENNFSSIYINSELARILAFYPIRESVIFPVERNSIYTFSKELSINRNLLVDHFQNLSKGEKFDPFDFISKSSNRYPLAIKDGLATSDDLEKHSKKKSSYFDTAIIIERELLNGELSISKEGDLKFSSNKRKLKKLPIHMTASIVKTLSSLIFYLKYQAEYGDLILIDEPEMNLHPDSQIILAKLFGKLHNLGFRLIISTHSDYIIREFNNLIMASNKNEEVQKISEKLGYGPDYQLSAKDVACYYFHFKNIKARKSNVTPLKVNWNGVDIASIDNEINNQNERMQELYFEINSLNDE